MGIDEKLGEDVFLATHPLIQRIPKELISQPNIARQYQGYISGIVHFSAYNNETVSIEEEISILIPVGYPIELPLVFILKNGNTVNYGIDCHFYPITNQLCLGSNWEIRKELHRDPSLNNLLKSLIIPHIAGITLKLNHISGSFPQGEYSHGIKGCIESLSSFFSIKEDTDSIISVLEFLMKPKRVANKMMCPFGCGQEYGKCHCKGNFQELKILFPNKEVKRMLEEIQKQTTFEAIQKSLKK